MQNVSAKQQKLAVPSPTEVKNAMGRVRKQFSLRQGSFGDPNIRSHYEGNITLLLRDFRDRNELYWLLTEALRIRSSQGKLAEAFRVADELDQLYEVDISKLHADIVESAAKQNLSEGDLTTLCFGCLYAAQTAVQRQQFSTPKRLLVSPGMEKLFKAAKSPGLNDARLEIIVRMQRIAKDQKIYARDRKRLEINPDDSAANLTVGRFLCLLCGDWENGLPYLAKSADEMLGPLARDELKAVTPEPTASIADRWWSFAEGAKADEQMLIQQHAACLYTRVLGELDEERNRDARERLSKFTYRFPVFDDSLRGQLGLPLADDPRMSIDLRVARLVLSNGKVDGIQGIRIESPDGKVTSVRRLEDLPNSHWKLHGVSIDQSQRMTEKEMQLIGSASELEHLHLDANRCDPAGMSHLRGLRNLKRLQTNGSNLCEDDFKFLNGLEQLEWLVLDISTSPDWSESHHITGEYIQFLPFPERLLFLVLDAPALTAC